MKTLIPHDYDGLNQSYNCISCIDISKTITI